MEKILRWLLYILEMFNDIHNLLQNLQPMIKFTIQLIFKEIPFLDTLVKKQNGQNIANIYYKPTDTQ